MTLRTHIAAALVALAVACAPCVPCAAAAKDDLAAYVASSAQRLVKSGASAGVSVGIIQNGQRRLVAGYGSSRIEPALAAGPGTVYDIGSVTKQFTAAAIMLLVRDGKLSLDDPVAKYVPSAASGATVRVRNLLNHTSGYVDYYPMDYVTPEMERPTTDDAIISTYATRPLEFAPGSKFSYSNTNYTLLGKIIEAVTGQMWSSFVGERILRPLGMLSTYCDSPRVEGPRHAFGYTSFALGPLTRATPEGAGWAGAAGCLASSPGDLLRWDGGLIDHTVLDAGSLAQMSARTVLTDGSTNADGFGLVSGVWNGHRYLAHDGGVAGFSSFNMVFPDDKAALVLLFNTDNVGYGAFASGILHKLFNVPQAAPPKPAPPAATASPPPADPKQTEAVAVVSTTLAALQRGALDRTAFTADFNAFLTPQLAAAAASSLAPLGAPAHVTAEVSENHGTEFTVAQVAFRTRTLTVTMRRTPDKKISEFLIRNAP